MTYGWTGHTPLPHRVKENIRARDRHTCQGCGDHGHHVDHITPLAEGGTHDPDNLQTLCTSCHGRKTVLEAARGQKRRAQAGRHPTERHPGLVR